MTLESVKISSLSDLVIFTENERLYFERKHSKQQIVQLIKRNIDLDKTTVPLLVKLNKISSYKLSEFEAKTSKRKLISAIIEHYLDIQGDADV